MKQNRIFPETGKPDKLKCNIIWCDDEGNFSFQRSYLGLPKSHVRKNGKEFIAVYEFYGSSLVNIADNVKPNFGVEMFRLIALYFGDDKWND